MPRRSRHTFLLPCVFFALVSFGLVVGCKSRSLLKTSTTAYIIGVNDIQALGPANKQKVAPQAINADVLIATRLASKKTKFCSGTLIEAANPGGPLRIVSNHHCFADSDTEGKALKNLLPEACGSTVVYFGFEVENPGEAFSTECVPGSLRTDYNGDLAVFQLTQTPPEKYQPLKFYTGDDFGVGRRALIIHHPDIQENAKFPPRGGPKLPTAAVTLDDCKVIGLFDNSELDLDRTLPYSIRHSCDLIHGSSGSALIDYDTSTIIAVNWGGIKITQGTDTRTENVATRADYVQAFLAGNLEAFAKGGPHFRPRVDNAAESGLSEEASSKKKGRKNFAAGITKAACGTIGISEVDQAPIHLMQLFLVLLLPFGIMIKTLARGVGRKFC